MQELGYNYRLTDFQAALGISQLERAKAGLERRHEIVRRYNEAFSGIDGIKTPFNTADVYHAYHLYIIQVADRLGLYNYPVSYTHLADIMSFFLPYLSSTVAKSSSDITMQYPFPTVSTTAVTTIRSGRQ